MIFLNLWGRSGKLGPAFSGLRSAGAEAAALCSSSPCRGPPSWRFRALPTRSNRVVRVRCPKTLQENYSGDRRAPLLGPEPSISKGRSTLLYGPLEGGGPSLEAIGSIWRADVEK